MVAAVEAGTGLTIGVLALQGSFAEHAERIRSLGAGTRAVRLPDHLEGLDGLIIPGGESTTIGKLADRFGLIQPLRRFAARRAVWGTCAGMIFMARRAGRDQPLLAVMDIAVARNAFGRQVDSFESGVRIEGVAEAPAPPFPGIFIRAPKVTDAWDGARVIARLPDGSAVGARQGHLLATAFHPEICTDLRLHRYFVDIIHDPVRLNFAPKRQSD